MTEDMIKEMKRNPERFIQQEYGKLKIDDENNCFEVICNDQYISCAEEANSKEGWCKIIIFDPNEINTKFFNPCLTLIDGNLEIARTTLYGDVKIFKIDPTTKLPKRKNK